MATISEVKAGLDEISKMIKESRLRLVGAKTMVTTQETNLNSIPTRFSDILAEIDGYTPTGAFEELCKDEKAKLTTEFIALRNAATSAKADLATQTEF